MLRVGFGTEFTTGLFTKGRMNMWLAPISIGASCMFRGMTYASVGTEAIFLPTARCFRSAASRFMSASARRPVRLDEFTSDMACNESYGERRAHRLRRRRGSTEPSEQQLD